MDKRPKILHVIPTINHETGGPVQALIGFVNCTKEKVQSEIATTRSRLDSKELKRFRKSVGHIPVHCFRQIGRHSWNISLPMSEWLRKNTASYDLLHIHVLFSPMSTLAAFWARKNKIPYVVKPMGTLSFYTFFSTHPRLKRIYFSLFERYTIEGAAAVHFTTALEIRKIYPKFRMPKRVEIIPNPIPLAENGGLIRRKEPTKLKLLFMSRIDPKKGLELLIEALKQINKDRTKPIELMIAGSGEKLFVSKIKNQVHKAGLKENVRFSGFITGKEKDELLADAAVFVLPSYDENFGIAVAEALSAGVPVIVSDRVGIAANVKKYGAGIIVKCSVNSLKKGLNKLIEDPQLLSEMGQRGHRLVEENYNTEKVGKDLLRLYRQIINSEKC